MALVDLIVIIIIILSLVGGLFDGGVKRLFSLLAFTISLPIGGGLYPIAARLLAFLPPPWDNFIGFFITVGVVNIVITIVLLLPRKAIKSIWPEGIISRVIGGVLSVINAGMGFVLLAVALRAYPVIEWLRDAFMGAATIQSLMSVLAFVPALLPEVFRQTTATAAFLGF